MLELFHANKSTCSQKVRICLAEKGLDYVDNQINLQLGEQLTPEFLAHTGRIEDAKQASQVLYDRAPNFTRAFLRENLPATDPHLLDVYTEGLMKAGVPVIPAAFATARSF